MSWLGAVFAFAAALIAGGAAMLLASAETALARMTPSRAEALQAVDEEDDTDVEPDARVARLVSLSSRPAIVAGPATMLRVALVAASCALAALGGSMAGTPGAVVAGCVAVLALGVSGARARAAAIADPDRVAVKRSALMAGLARWGRFAKPLFEVRTSSAEPPTRRDEVDEHEVIALVEHSDSIDEQEQRRIKRAVSFDDTVAQDIMTPRTDLIAVRSGFAVSDALEVASMHGLSRLPVTGVESDIDDIIGAVHIKDLIVAHLDGNGASDIDTWLHDAPVVPTYQRAALLLENLRRGRFQMAIVVDEYGGVAGVVTVEDIVEELVGEIDDEFDTVEEFVEVVGPNEVLADGRAELELIEDAFGEGLPEGDYRTVAGCFFSRFGRVPSVGDQLTVGDFELVVQVMDDRRIARLSVKRVASRPKADHQNAKAEL